MLLQKNQTDIAERDSTYDSFVQWAMASRSWRHLQGKRIALFLALPVQSYGLDLSNSNGLHLYRSSSGALWCWKSPLNCQPTFA